jgi:hypothetical protein
MCYSTDTCLTQQWHIRVVEMSYNKPVLPLTFISSCLLALYVVGQLSHNVAAISSDGQTYTVLSSRRDGVRSHLGTHCDRASKQLLINVSGNTGLLYDISTTLMAH